MSENANGAIYGKIISVMKEIGAIGKDSENTQQKFKYRSIDAVYNRVQPLFARHGIFSAPSVLESTQTEGATKSGGRMFHVFMRVSYSFFAEDGSHVDTIVTGEAMDSGDKASNKAMAAAHKYAICQILQIPYEMIDPDKHSPEWAFEGKREFNEIKKEWWAKNKVKLETLSPEQRMDEFKAWCCQHAFRDFEALNFRQWQKPDFEAVKAALGETHDTDDAKQRTP